MEATRLRKPSIATVARKGGVGKSTLSVFLGAVYAQNGLRVCVVDLDPQASATRVLLPEQATRVRELGERLMKGTSLADLQVPSTVEDLSLVASGELLSVYESQIMADPLGVTKVAIALETLHRTDVDLIIIDTPPSLGPFTFGALMSSRWALIPTLCEDSSIRTLGSAVRTVSETTAANPDLRVLAIVGNRFERTTRHGVSALETIRSAFQGQVATTVVPKAAAIAEAFQPGAPLDPRAPGYKALVALAEELIERMERPTERRDGESTVSEAPHSGGEELSASRAAGELPAMPALREVQAVQK